MADEYDVVERLEKQIEGSNLALAAVAEVLHKMDTRIRSRMTMIWNWLKRKKTSLRSRK